MADPDAAAEAAALAAARVHPTTHTTHKLWKARCEAFDALGEACRAGPCADESIGEIENDRGSGPAATSTTRPTEGFRGGVCGRSVRWLVVRGGKGVSGAAGLEKRAAHGKKLNLFSSTVDLLVAGLGDANAAAQDKALDAFIAFLSRPGPPCPAVARVAHTAASTLASKALKGRPATVARASDACLLLVEHGSGDAVTAALASAFKDKVPKVPAAALGVLSAAVSAYGAPALVDLAGLFSALPPLFEARAGPVRDAAKKLAADLAVSLGMGAVGPALLGRIPEAARKEVEKMVEGGEAGGPTRQTRATAAAPASGGSTADIDMADAPPAAAAFLPPPAIDAFSLAAPVELGPALGKAFHAGMASAKWSDRRAALQKLSATAAAPRLAPGCPALADGVRELRKVLATDSNAACVAEAAAAVGALGAGLRREFGAPARVLVPALLEKLKDKNTGVALASAAAVKALLIHCLPLADAADEVAAVFAHKNPASRAAALRLVAGVAEETPRDSLTKAVFPTLLPAAAKAAADAVPDVRDAAVAALAALARCGGGLALLDRLPNGALDEARRKKVEAAMVGGGSAGGALPGRRPGTGVARAAAAAAPAAAAAAPTRPALSPRTLNLSPATAPAPAEPAAPARPGLGGRGGPAGPAAGGRPPVAARRPAAGVLPTADDDPITSSSALTRTDAEDRLAALLGAKAAALQSPDWKARLDAMDAVAALAGGCEGGPRAGPYTGPPDLIQSLAHIPGWADKNFQVTARIFHVMAAAAAGGGGGGPSSTPPFTRRDAAVLIDGAAEKLADAKVRPAAAAALDAAAEAVGPAFVAARLHARAAAARNPRVLVEADAWIGRAVTEFGLAPGVGWDVRAVVGALKQDLGAPAPAVRAAAVAALAALHAHLGPPLADLVRPDIKPALMVTLDAAFAGAPAGSAPAPVRGVKGGCAGSAKPPAPAAPAPAAARRTPTPVRAAPAAPSPPVRRAAATPTPPPAAVAPPPRPAPPQQPPCLSAAPGKDARLRALGRAGPPSSSSPSFASEEGAILADLIPLASPALAALLQAGTPAAVAEAAALVAAQAASGRAGAGAVSTSDLLLRWGAARLAVPPSSSPPAHTLSFLTLVTEVFRALGRAGGRLAASEAASILPALVCAGLGSGVESVRAAAQGALAAALPVTSPVRVLEAVAGGLTVTSTSPPRLRVEALVAMADLVQAGAAGGGGGGGGALASAAAAAADPRHPRPFAAVAACVADPDPAVREAALDVLAVLVAVEGAGAAWAAVGPMAAGARAAVEARAGGGGGGGGGAAPAAAAPALTPPPPVAVVAPPRLPAAALASPSFSPAYRAADTPAAQRRPCPLASAGSAPTPLPPPTPAVGAPTPTPPGFTPGVALLGGAAVASRAAARSSLAAAAAPPPPPPRPASPPPPPDPVAAWACALADMASSDLATAVEGMKAACYEMMDVVAAGGAAGGRPAALGAMIATADELVAGLAARAAQAFGLAVSDAAAGVAGGAAPPAALASACHYQPRGVRAAKYALNALLQAFDLRAVGLAVRAPALRDAAGVLLGTLLDAGALPAACGPDGAALIKAVNVLMLRLLAGSDRARAVDALLALLARPPPSVVARDERAAAAAAPAPHPPPLPSALFGDLVVKCLIKLARTLDAGGGVLDPAVDPAALLASAHAWFEAVGPADLARRAAASASGGGGDRPLRAVQTLVHEVCRLTPGGPAGVRAALGRAVGPAAGQRPPPAVAGAVEAALAALAAGTPPPPPAVPPPPAALIPPPSPAAELASIFRLIGARETSEAGLDRLALLLVRAAAPPGSHGLDLAPHLAKTSPHFRAFISSGLTRAAGRLGLGDLPPCGVEGLAKAAGVAVAAPPAAAPAAVAPAPPCAPSSLESLRARLARVRLAGRPSVGGDAAAPAAAPAATTAEALHARMQALRR